MLVDNVDEHLVVNAVVSISQLLQNTADEVSETHFVQ